MAAPQKKEKPLCPYYFGGKGICLKGDSCNLSHAPCLPRRPDNKDETLLVNQKILSSLGGDSEACREFKEVLLRFIKDRISAKEFLDKIVEFKLKDLLIDIASTLGKYPNKQSQFVQAIKTGLSSSTACREAKKEEEPEAKENEKEAEVKEQEAEAKKIVVERATSDLILVHAAEESLEIEKDRLKKLQVLEAENNSLKSSSAKDFSCYEKQIAKAIRQIRWTKETADAKICELVRVFEDPDCPKSISIATFAKQMVSAKRNPFACSYVIVCVTSQCPQAMDILLAEFHRASSYTVPKHIVDSGSSWDSDAYERLDSVMRLYGALVQTDMGLNNSHGIEHGWAWLDRFLDNISANNRAAATALNAFLQTAGFGLHQRSKSRFLKAVDKLKKNISAKKNSSEDLKGIMSFLNDHIYLEEPKGRKIERHFVSYLD